ncbi:glutathione S-transferase A-like [Brachionus plicatilis]|uniref:Glutathione S-transferase A-like n=1 Tax=Brachionus plicatilis TaxID=10195 RepID=A0A3M7PYS2_BRAPC|nr:glutathione S-transferase A-like [Brachionus plicatilis]
MSQEIFLYWGSGSTPCWRIQLVLEEKNLQYEQKLLSFEKQEHKSEEIMKLNSRGQLPTFKIGDLVINESIAACLYLEDNFKTQGTCLIPKESQPSILQRTFEALNLQKFCNENIVYYVWRTPIEKQDGSLLIQKKKDLNVELERWENYLAEQKTEFIASSQFSMADVIFFPQLAFCVRMGYPLESKCPKLFKYYETLRKRSSIEKSWPPHWKNTQNSTMLSDC